MNASGMMFNFFFIIELLGIISSTIIVLSVASFFIGKYVNTKLWVKADIESDRLDLIRYNLYKDFNTVANPYDRINEEILLGYGRWIGGDNYIKGVFHE